jgi:hypothetical protein
VASPNPCPPAGAPQRRAQAGSWRALLLGGILTAAEYFDGDAQAEREIRDLARLLYTRVDWRWAQNGGATVTHGWRPESGFLPYRWQGYDEALLLYVLGLGSPTHPLCVESYRAWASTYRWRTVFGIEYLYAGPLFTHQLSHVWIDFRGIQDAFMRQRGIDYFQNSRRATLVQQQYGIRNPRGYARYGELCWGITASDGPGDVTRQIHGVERRFFDYQARAVPDGLDRREDCERIVDNARRGGRSDVGCIVLGRGADEKKVAHWDAVADYLAKRATRLEAVARVARRYHEWAAIFMRRLEA